MDRQIVVDGTGHIAGKLAACVAKKLLEGYKVAVVCCENIMFTGPLHRRVGKYNSYKDKRCVVNPNRGAFHYKEPSKYFFKILRTMVRRKSTKGKECLTRVETFESIPRCYFNVERVMFPKALNEQTNNPEGKTCLMGELLEKFGFNNRKLANDLTKSTIESEEKINSVVREKESAINEFKKTESFKKDLKTRLDALL